MPAAGGTPGNAAGRRSLAGGVENFQVASPLGIRRKKVLRGMAYPASVCDLKIIFIRSCAFRDRDRIARPLPATFPRHPESPILLSTQPQLSRSRGKGATGYLGTAAPVSTNKKAPPFRARLGMNEELLTLRTDGAGRQRLKSAEPAMARVAVLHPQHDRAFFALHTKCSLTGRL